ncbi:hypothetical protein ACH6CV_14405 [Bacillota bacterium Meth-B3]
MKCFQILGSFVHWDASRLYPSIADIPPNTYAPDIQFVDAPDFVFEGWGFDADAEGDARFIQPTPPEGWLYDPETGMFKPINPPPEPEPEPNAIDQLLDYFEGKVTNNA